MSSTIPSDAALQELDIDTLQQMYDENARESRALTREFFEVYAEPVRNAFYGLAPLRLARTVSVLAFQMCRWSLWCRFGRVYTDWQAHGPSVAMSRFWARWEARQHQRLALTVLRVRYSVKWTRCHVPRWLGGLR
jgi:hypothetical protein